MKNLTPRQEAFARAISAGKRSCTAASLAGYSNSSVEGCRLLKRDYIQRRIAELQQESIERCEIDLDIITAELLEIATGPSIATFIDQTEDGLVWKEQLSETQMKMIQETVPIRDVLGDWKSIRLHSKSQAIASLISYVTTPEIDPTKKAAIVNALCRIGTEQRGFSEIEERLLRDTLLAPH